MSGDLGTSIILTMAPIFVLMIGLVVYGVVKNSNKNKGQSRHESDAIIEAQAMLAKYQKEQAEKQAQTEGKKEEDKPEEKESKPEEKPEEKSEEKSEDKPEEKIEVDEKNDEPKKTVKPSAEAPIGDTTELEPDIDKTES